MSNQIILGIDEVGRGPWAGPLVVGAVILQKSKDTPPQPSLWQNLNDSKKLTAKRRLELDQVIRAHAPAYATGWVSNAELDQYGLSASLKLATRRAVKQILAKKVPFTSIIIDGTVNFLQNTPLEHRVSTLKKADSLIKEVSAASIIAKVARDKYMVQLAEQYPGYGFDKHVGYGTAAHKTALQSLGPCPEHRVSFRPIREIIQNSPNFAQSRCKKYNIALNSVSNSAPAESYCKNYNIMPNTVNSTTKGQHAEKIVREHLESLGHTIIAHNYKTKTYEIDLISTKNNCIYFTEVKYSQNPQQEQTALIRITKKKQQQMQFASQAFLATNPTFANFNPFLAVAAVEGREFAVKDWFTLE